MTECEKLRIGQEFLISHTFPAAFRDEKHDRCYCNQCYASSQPNTYVVGLHTYIIPREWTRFSVFVDKPFAIQHDVWNKWVTCYHGTSIENAISVMEHRQLLLPSDIKLDGEELKIRQGHIKGENYFFTTPTINYAGLDYYASSYVFLSPTNGKQYKIKVALQCKQKPDSFVVQPETVGARARHETICPHVSNDKMEWKTKQRSAIMPYGLMLHIMNYNDLGNGMGHRERSVTTYVYASFQKTFQQVSCPHCCRTIVWKDYKEGTVTTCTYIGCQKTFQQVSCPHCYGTIVWKRANYQIGTVITCIYAGCQKTFQQVNCPHCCGTIVWKDANYKEGTVTTCIYADCQKTFQLVNCPHCSGSNFWKNADYKQGTVATCTNTGCQKTFQQINCPHCSGPHVWKKADCEQGTVITCIYANCKKTFQQINCPPLICFD